MYFSIGAHPGFNCNIGDMFRACRLPDSVRTERIDAESILIDETFPVIENEKEIIITKEIFDKDALIISGLKGDHLTLKGSDYYVDFTYFNAPVMGIWAKPDAPYVCLSRGSE